MEHLSTREWPDYVLLDYLGVTAARRNGGLGRAILKMLAAREAGRRTVLVEAEAERSGGPEEERPLRLRRLGFYARTAASPCMSFNCGLLCQVLCWGPPRRIRWTSRRLTVPSTARPGRTWS